MTVKELRARYHLTQKALSDLTGIPLRTIENWEGNKRKPPEYILTLLESYLEHKEKEGR